MKKIKQFHKQQSKLTPEQIVEFLENFTQMAFGIDKKTKLISVRVPENILQPFKIKAHRRNLKYQSQIINLMRNWLMEESLTDIASNQ